MGIPEDPFGTRETRMQEGTQKRRAQSPTWGRPVATSIAFPMSAVATAAQAKRPCWWKSIGPRGRPEPLGLARSRAATAGAGTATAPGEADPAWRSPLLAVSGSWEAAPGKNEFTVTPRCDQGHRSSFPGVEKFHPLASGTDLSRIRMLLRKPRGV